MIKLKTIRNFFIFLIIFLFLIFIFSLGFNYKSDELEYGITFSKKQAENLGLDWQKLYEDILVDLGVKKIRLAAYWDEVEPVENEFQWIDLDWQIKKASEQGAKIILSVGGRLPRWPECHFPEWASNLEKEKREEKTLNYIETVIKRYSQEKSITAWQIENEPFLSNFGECPKLDADFLDKEILLVRSLDSRPIVITDSGELSVWVPAAKRADIFGTTMYRDTYSKNLRAYVHYPIEPDFFHFKKNVARLFAGPDKWIVIELQAEPWGPIPYQELSQEERDRTMNFEKFKDIIKFSQQTGFKEFYLWGVEWWYWEKEKQNNSAIWEEAKKLFEN